MEGQSCVLPILVAVLIFHACGWTSVTDARDDADVMARLAALEKGQRESQAEIKTLRETVAAQKDTIENQSMKLRTLEQDVLTLKASQHRQFKRFQRTEQRLKSFLKYRHRHAHMNAAHAAGNEGNTETVVSSPRRHGTGKNNVTRHRGARAMGERSINMNGSKRQASEGVAFTAYLDHDQVLAALQAIKFNKIITNDGGGYNNNTGVFTCVIDGMYMFYFAIGERDAHQQWASLRVNSQNIVDGAVEGAQAYQDLQGGNMATYRLQQGDSVWVENVAASNSHLEGDAVWRLTTFTGVMLYPL